MITTRTFYLLMYDITHDRTLQKVAIILQQHGFERMNHSVWLGWKHPLTDAGLKQKLQPLLRNEKAKGSVLYIIPMSKGTLQKTRSIMGHKPANLEYWLGDSQNIFF